MENVMEKFFLLYNLSGCNLWLRPINSVAWRRLHLTWISLIHVSKLLNATYGWVPLMIISLPQTFSGLALWSRLATGVLRTAEYLILLSICMILPKLSRDLSSSVRDLLSLTACHSHVSAIKLYCLVDSVY